MKVLLLVDLQKNLMARKLFQKELFIETIAGAIHKFREMNQLVIFIQHNNPFLKFGTEAWEISEFFDRKKSDPVIQKEAGNAFEKPDLLKILHDHQINEVLMGGKNAGLHVKLLRNGHSNWAKDAEVKIQKVEAELAEKGILTVEEVL